MSGKERHTETICLFPVKNTFGEGHYFNSSQFDRFDYYFSKKQKKNLSAH